MKRSGTWCVGVTLALVLTLVPSSAHAGQHQAGASYLDWSGAVLSETSSISQVIQPLEVSPFSFWEVGWSWSNAPDGGYAGIQSSGRLFDGAQQVQDIAIFSLWNATESVPGPAARCGPFGGEGVGLSCRSLITLRPGYRYGMRVSADTARGPGWWTASVDELTLGQTTVLGSIKIATPNARADNWNNFIEFFGPSVPCNEVPAASAKFYAPVRGDGGELHSPVFSRPSEPCVNSAADLPPEGKLGDAIMRFGGPAQPATSRTMPGRVDSSSAAADLRTLTQQLQTRVDSLVRQLESQNIRLKQLQKRLRAICSVRPQPRNC